MIIVSESAVLQLKNVMSNKEDSSNTMLRVWIGGFG